MYSVCCEVSNGDEIFLRGLLLIETTQWSLVEQRGFRDGPHSLSNFFHFHAVFSNQGLVPPQSIYEIMDPPWHLLDFSSLSIFQSKPYFIFV